MFPTKATTSQAKEIYKIFDQYKDIFPHIRYDYLQRKIESSTCIYHDNVVITYTIYKRKTKLGTCYTHKGDVIIHQIVNAEPSNGKSKEVLKNFLDHTVEGKIVWLSVRSDNDRACSFYEKMKFTKMGTIDWMGGLLEGHVFCYNPNSNLGKLL